MSEQTVGTLTHRASDAIGRRRTLLTLGTAALIAAAAHPAVSEVGHASKKTKRIRNKRCKKQVGKCSSSLERLCTVEPAECEAIIDLCCGHFSNCDASTALSCIFIDSV